MKQIKLMDSAKLQSSDNDDQLIDWTSLQKRIDDDDVIEVKKDRSALKKEKREKQTEEEKELKKEKKLTKKRVWFNMKSVTKTNLLRTLGTRGNPNSREAKEGRGKGNQNHISQWRWWFKRTTIH